MRPLRTKDMTIVNEHKPAFARTRTSRRAAASTRWAAPVGRIDAWARQAGGLPEIRAELVDRVRAEIAAGTYETPEKLQRAVERMLDELFAV